MTDIPTTTRTGTRSADRWLADHVQTAGGEVRWPMVLKAAEAEGLNDRTLRRARTRIGLEPLAGQDGAWRLPGQLPASVEDPSVQSPPVLGPVRLPDLQRTLDGCLRDLGGRGIRSAGRSAERRVAEENELRRAVGAEVTARLARIGAHPRPATLSQIVAAIVCGNRPIASQDSFPEARPAGVDMRARALRDAEQAREAAECALAKATQYEANVREQAAS